MTNQTEPADWHEPEHAHPTADDHRTDRDDPLGMACDLAAAYESHEHRGAYEAAAEPAELARAAGGMALVSLAHDIREMGGQGAMAVHFLGHISRHLATMCGLGLAAPGHTEWHGSTDEEGAELTHIGGPRDVIEKIVMDTVPEDADAMAAAFASAAARLSPVARPEATPLSAAVAGVAELYAEDYPSDAVKLREAAAILALSAAREVTPATEEAALDRAHSGAIPALGRLLAVAAEADTAAIRGATTWLTQAVHGRPPFEEEDGR